MQYRLSAKNEFIVLDCMECSQSRLKKKSVPDELYVQLYHHPAIPRELKQPLHYVLLVENALRNIFSLRS